jgi:type II secretory pathway component HofQ
MRRFLSICLLSLLALAARGEGPANRFESYPVGFADAASVEQMARAIVGADGTALVDAKSARLLVLTTDERHALIREMVNRLNLPPRNVRIDVNFKNASKASERELSVSGSGAVIVGEGGTAGHIALQPKIVDLTAGASSDVTQTLLVASGREGILRVGESVPYLEWFADYGLRHGYITQRVNWQNVGAQLVVEPTIVGDGPMIRVRLTPELSGMVDGQPLRTKFSRVATEVTVQDGQTFQIGGLGQDAEFYSRFLIGSANSDRREKLEIFLTPRIAGGGPAASPPSVPAATP